MKYSLAVALLIGAAAYTNGKRFQVKTLAQATSAAGWDDTPLQNNGIDQGSDWDPVGSQWMSDAYGNSMYVTKPNGNGFPISYIDRAGVSWYRSID